jgi:hypothetical protein
MPRRIKLTAEQIAVLLVGIAIGALVSWGATSIPIQASSRHHRLPVCTRRRRKRCRIVRTKRIVIGVASSAHPSGMITTTTTITIPAPSPDPNLWPAPGPQDPSAPQPQLVDPTGVLTFCGYDQYGLLEVCEGASVAGAYVDDTDPNRDADIATAAAHYSLVIAAQAPEGPCPYTQPEVVCAREWYPFDCRYPPGEWGPIPVASAYIVQWWFAWEGCGAPTSSERQSLLAQVEALHPRLVLLY